MTISTTDDNAVIDGIKNDYAKQYESTQEHLRFRRAFIPAEYLSFFTDGNEQKDRIKKSDLTTGEPQIVRNSVYASSDLPVSAEFRVRIDKKKYDEEIVRDEATGGTPENPTTSYSLPEQIFIPQISFEVSNLTDVILRGWDDYSSRITPIKSNQQNRLLNIH